MFTKKTIRDIDLQNKCVLVHAELDAPLTDDGRELTSDYRVKSALPTIKYLEQQNCRIVLISKLGRPGGKVIPEKSLAPVARCLSGLLGRSVKFVSDCVGDEVKQAVDAMQPGDIIMLENLRFHPEEQANDEGFARYLAESAGADVFVQDCFALAHRREAATDAITRVLPSVAGFHLEKEVDTLTNVMHAPKRPLMAIIGGAKIAEKIDLVYKFIEIADFVAIGGAMANTFLAAEGIDVAKSLYEADDIPVAKDILNKAREKARSGVFSFYLPQDGVVATSLDKTAATRIVDWDAHIIADIEAYPSRPTEHSRTIEPGEMIVDIGPFSGAFIAGGVQLAKTVVWNGTMGVTETPSLQGGPVGPFAHGTDVIVDAMLGQFGNKPFTVVGGGDTVGYVQGQGLAESFGHVSTGGGASLELLAGRELPGVAALNNKDNL